VLLLPGFKLLLQPQERLLWKKKSSVEEKCYASNPEWLKRSHLNQCRGLHKSAEPENLDVLVGHVYTFIFGY
jgi:hypothetical protein